MPVKLWHSLILNTCILYLIKRIIETYLDTDIYHHIPTQKGKYKQNKIIMASVNNGICPLTHIIQSKHNTTSLGHLPFFLRSHKACSYCIIRKCDLAGIPSRMNVFFTISHLCFIALFLCLSVSMSNHSVMLLITFYIAFILNTCTKTN